MSYNFPSIVRLKHAVIFIFTAIAMNCNAQFIKGIGIMGGLNMSNQRWQIDTNDLMEVYLLNTSITNTSEW
jgi:hypothetical protein